MEEGQALPAAEAKYEQIASRFETTVYPVGARFFAPAIIEPRVTVLHATGLGIDAYAYYADVDELPRSLFSLRACLIIRFRAHSGSTRRRTHDCLALQEKKLGKSLFNNCRL